MYLLFALTAGLVGCFHINRLYKFSEGVWREFRECGVSAYPLNKLFKVFYLPFLYFDFFLQIYDFNFKLRLFVLVSYVFPFAKGSILSICKELYVLVAIPSS